MIVVIPFFNKDAESVEKNLELALKLDSGLVPYRCLLSYDQSTDASKVRHLAKTYFREVMELTYPVPPNPQWPNGPNHIWQQTATEIYIRYREPWFWWEPDAVPLKAGWLSELETEYSRAGKPFMGHIVEGMGHMNGVGIYPHNVVYYCPDALLATNAAWDVVMRAKTISFTHPANHLIDRQLADRGSNMAMTFPDPKSMEVIRSGAVLFHGCKDLSLQTQMLGVKPSGKVSLIRKVLALVKPEPKAALPMIQTPTTVIGKRYYHSGNLGDVIYALYAIAKAGGGDLVIGPHQMGTSPCANPISMEQFNLLHPLLKAQPYLRTVSWTPRHPVNVKDMNKFRDKWFSFDERLRHNVHTLCGMHCHILGVPFNPAERWLHVPNPVVSENIVLSRTHRHRNWDMPYGEMLKRWRERMLFVGHQSELGTFEMCWGKVKHQPVTDFLHMARVIAGAKGFVGNQSFPLAIAMGVGVPIMLEVHAPSADCTFKRPNVFTQKNAVSEFEKAL